MELNDFKYWNWRRDFKPRPSDYKSASYQESITHTTYPYPHLLLSTVLPLSVTGQDRLF